jgi:hypothetical protein
MVTPVGKPFTVFKAKEGIMILNETLQKHRRCLDQCETETEECDRNKKDTSDCREKTDACRRDCDFDHGP